MSKRAVLSKIGLLGLVVPSVMACSQGFKIDENVKSAIDSNFAAIDYASWTLSANHPDRLFETLRNEIQKGRDVIAVSVELCQSLESISDQALMLFEKQIFELKNERLLRPCLESLKEKLDQRHLKTREEFKRQGFATLDNNQDRFNGLESSPAQAAPAREAEIRRIEEPRSSDPDLEVTTSSAVTISRAIQIQFKILKRDFSTGPRLVDGGLPHKHVALTFDDGPHPSFTPMITRALEDRGVRGQFFMLANNVKIHQDLARRIADRGHSIGNHTVTHPCLGGVNQCRGERRVGFEAGVREIVNAHRILFDVLGAVDPIFRFPYGASTPELRQFLRANQIADFFWNIDSNDWKANQTNGDVLNRTMAQVNQQQKGILLFHDIHRRTAEMIPELLRRLALESYTVVILAPSDETLRFRHPFLDGSYKP